MSNHQRPRESVQDETLSRTKRIETRLTQLMIGLGVDTRTQKPVYDAERNILTVPSIHSSLKEILDNLPENCHDDVAVCLGGNRVVWLNRARE